MPETCLLVIVRMAGKPYSLCMTCTRSEQMCGRKVAGIVRSLAVDRLLFGFNTQYFASILGCYFGVLKILLKLIFCLSWILDRGDAQSRE